jgi:hypothetical protein
MPRPPDKAARDVVGDMAYSGQAIQQTIMIGWEFLWATCIVH